MFKVCNSRDSKHLNFEKYINIISKGGFPLVHLTAETGTREWGE